jgi:hypothetical protein
LDQEHLPSDHSCRRCLEKEGKFRCLSCFGCGLLCHSCCLEAHSTLPFHSIEKWTGEFFKKTSLHAEGFILHLGHGGLCCPANTSSSATEANAAVDGEDEELEEADEVLLEGWEPKDKRALVLIDISGVYQLNVSWCCCPNSPDHATQLFQHQLFSASTSRPSTAFTFGVLEYFHIDAVECKTSASNFSSKLRRLTDFSNPQSVPVSKPHITFNNYLMNFRTGIEN